MNCTQGTYRSNHKGQWEMYNLVRENGRSAARLTAWAESGYGTVIWCMEPRLRRAFPQASRIVV